MDAKTRMILRFVFGITGAVVCVSGSVFTSIYAPHIAMIVDPIFLSIAITCLGIAARVIGYKIGAAAAIQKDDDQKDANKLNDVLKGKHVHLHIYSRHSKPRRFFEPVKSKKLDYTDSEAKRQGTRRHNIKSGGNELM